jgi:thioredoxin reductase (NADPH)
VVAGGVGAFQPRRLKLDGLDPHRGTQLFEHAGTLHAHAGRRIVIVGGGEAAVMAAIDAADAGASAPASITLIHRRDDLDAAATALDRLRELRAAGRIAFVAGQPESIVEDDDRRLAALGVLCSDGATRTVPLDALFVLLGWSPKLGPIADWGLALEKKQLVVDSQRFETSTPGIFAVGDVTIYPGKQKLIVCGFHEATLAAFAIGERVWPDRAQPLQYTTTSTKLHKLLGVSPTLP